MDYNNIPDIEHTPEKIPLENEISGHISRIFDSVNCCNEFISAGVKNEYAKDRVRANMEHVIGMVAKVWISDNLTDQQRADIDSTIAASKAFLESF